MPDSVRLKDDSMKRRSFFGAVVAGVSSLVSWRSLPAKPLTDRNKNAGGLCLKFQPFDKQIPPLLSASPVVMVVTDPRGGKTKLGTYRTLLDAITQEGFQQGRDNRYSSLVVAPSVAMIRRIIMPEFLAMVPADIFVGQLKDRLILRGRRCETDIFFRSNLDGLVGLGFHRAWIDEFMQCSDRIHDEVRVRLSDRKGRLFLTGTPNGGVETWPMALSRSYMLGNNVDFFNWNRSDNPHVGKL